MDLKGIILSEMSGRERLIPCDFTYMWNLKNYINKLNKNKLPDTENRLVVTREEGSQGFG